MADLDPDDDETDMTARKTSIAEDGRRGGRNSAVGVARSTVAKLREMIRDGRMKAGEALPSQRDLARDLRVSRATLREALSILATIGEITQRPGGRSIIANSESISQTPSWRFAVRYSLSEVYQFRYIVESHAAQLAAITHTQQELDELKEITESFRKATRARDLVAYTQADFDFHQIIMRISHNKLLVDMHHTFASVLSESQRVPVERRGSLWIAVKEHERILEAIAMDDPDGASYYMRKHISMAGSRAGLPAIELP